MLVLFLFLCLIVLYLSYKLLKNIINPVSITVISWVIIIIIYNYYIYKTSVWVPLSVKFYFILLCYIVCFSFFGLCFSLIRLPSDTDKVYLGFKFKFLLLCSFLGILYYVVCMLGIIRIIGYAKIRDELETLPVTVKLASYFQPVGLCLVFYSWGNIRKKSILFFISLLFILTLGSIFLSASKGGYFQVLFCILYFLHIKGQLNKRTVSFVFLAFIAIVILLQMFRNNNDNAVQENIVIDFLYTYFLSPLPALDLLITGKINLVTDSFGGNSFGFIYRVLNKFGIAEEPSYVYRNDNWVGVPYPTNVFTLLGNYYIDFSFLGVILIACVYGSLFGYIYSSSNSKNSISRVMYGLFVYCLVFQFFGDWFFAFFSSTLQFVFWLHFIHKRIKIK